MKAASELGARALRAIKNFQTEQNLRQSGYYIDELEWCNGYLDQRPKDW
jgi:hypothetical protein